MIWQDMVTRLSITSMSTSSKCEDCIMGKQCHHLFDTVVRPESMLYEHIALDLWGPTQVQTTGGKTFMMVVMDQAGVDCKVWFLVYKTKEGYVLT